ncbi:MAG: thiosulfate oxidation carrier complex protein SoxZ [Alphaproteobacteria bacterium]|mgnify:FL=1|nr:thiosulfate oxidation carrier complex protein SoxZ [Alphaproteobacteria bacterium]MAW58380.1 thiosulfate oxidation carrier complex protein SoxZ [Alphaproteobacteria bacterium]|tara:strand:- start:69 stop:479 length:411 start_codon:yes stop_codon:yes gene_type:complete
MANEERKNWRRRLKVPKSANKGEIIIIKTMAEHVMEPGVRRDPETGVIYPKKIIDTVICRFNGMQIFKSQWYSGVSANPFMSFKMKAITSGLVEVEWVDDYGQSSYKKAVLIVYDSDGKEILPIKIDSINPSKDIM